jgi:D-alanine-D-alanine ligase
MWRLAAGACAVADFRFDDRIEGTGLICLEADTQPGTTRTSSAPEFSQTFAGVTFDELVQWMVQDASLDR